MEAEWEERLETQRAEWAEQVEGLEVALAKKHEEMKVVVQASSALQHEVTALNGKLARRDRESAREMLERATPGGLRTTASRAFEAPNSLQSFHAPTTPAAPSHQTATPRLTSGYTPGTTPSWLTSADDSAVPCGDALAAAPTALGVHDTNLPAAGALTPSASARLHERNEALKARLAKMKR